jgi:hypothetical protein
MQRQHAHGQSRPEWLSLSQPSQRCIVSANPSLLLDRRNGGLPVTRKGGGLFSIHHQSLQLREEGLRAGFVFRARHGINHVCASYSTPLNK